jgi:ATP-binding cassette, subfamily B, bacterial
MQPIEITTFQALRRSFRLLIQATPKEISYSIALNIIRGVAPSAVLFLDKLIIDEVSRLLSQTQTAQPLDLMLSQSVLLGSIVGVLSFKLLDDALDTIGDILTSSQRDRVQGFVQEKVLEKVANFDDIALFENPELLNIVQLAKSGVFRVQQLAFSIRMIITGIFTFLPSTGLAVAIAWWVPLAILVSSLPSIYTQRKYIEIIWGVQKKQAKTHREMDLSFQVLTGENYAKELRLFGLQELWLDRWNNQFKQFFIEMQRVRKEAAIITLLWSAFSRIGVALPFVYVVVGALERRYTLGDLALYSGLIVQVERSLHILVYSFNNLYEIALGVTPIFQLLELESNLKSTAAGTASMPPELEDSKQDLSLVKDKVGIQIKDLSFCYPGSDKSTVANLNLTINSGEMLVVVGENGAGKTTLGKLLGRLYDPTAGAIEWNGQDLRNYSLEEVRSRIAVVMQDYARFPTTVKENVGFGNLLSLSDDVAINAAISEAGIAAKVNSLEKGLDTPLGKQLEDGIDLSGGQWQRIAIARALMRLSSVEMLIFDEPTAALDPKTEHEIYNIFRQIAVGKTTIVISHRLGLAKIADRIAVMENGKIVEIGNHDELIAANGIYCAMFTRQASSYV